MKNVSPQAHKRLSQSSNITVKSWLWDRGSQTELHHVALRCIVDSSSSSLSTVSCPLSLPISLRLRCFAFIGGTARLADAKQLRVADAWLFYGCPPSTDDRCQGSLWTATLHHATLFSLLAPLATPACLADAALNPTAPAPFPPATPICSHTHTHSYAVLCIHPSTVITSDSRHTGNQWITC